MAHPSHPYHSEAVPIYVAPTPFGADERVEARAPLRREREYHGDFSERFPPNPLSEFLATFLNSVVDLGAAIRDNILYKSPVVILSGSAALAANHFAIQHYPSLSGSSDLSFEGSVNVAKFVSVAFLLEAALSPLLQNVQRNILRAEDGASKRKIHAQTIQYLNPMALTLIYAYKTGLSIKALQGTLYTVGIFVLIKVLGKGYDFALKAYDKSNRNIEGYSKLE